MMSTDLLPQSIHFTLERLAEGVFAAIATPGGAGYSNAGIIDLGDMTLIFDTFDNPLAATDLLNAARVLTGKQPSWVINSHFHGDHTSGNMVFEGSTILSTAYTRRKLAESAEEIAEMKQDPTEIEQMIRQDRQEMELESNPARRKLLENQVTRWEYTLQTLPDFKLVLPCNTFEGAFTFHGTSRSATLIAPGEAHTSGDCYLLLKEEAIIFLGDLGFFQSPPFMPGSKPSAWIKRLEQFETSDIQVFVPGHGSLGSKADLQQQRGYIQMVLEMVDKAHQAGAPLESLFEEPLPAPYDNWALGSKRHQNNLRFLYEKEKQ